jgi:branched-chain amino acid transport system substrate-binding protein
MNLRKTAGSITLAATLAVSGGLAAHAETLGLGIIAPLTGPGAPWGMAAQKAGEILAAEVNAEGGLDVGGTRYQVEVIAYDDQYKAAEAVAAYNRLVNQDGVRYMVIATAAPTMALKQTVEDDRVVALTSAYTPEAIDADTRFMFRLYSVSGDLLPAYAGWLKDNIAERRLITLNPNDETGWGHSEVAARHYEENGFELLGSELYERSIRDFSPLLTRVVGQHPEIIDLGASSPGSAGLIVRQARDLGFEGRFVQTGGAGWASVVETAGAEGAEGLINILYADPDNPAYQDLAAKYREDVGQAPNEIIVPYYDAFRVLLRAIQEAGDVEDTEAVAAAFPEVLPMQSLQGDEMTWAHQQIRTYDYVGVLTDGRPVVHGKIK